MRRARGSGPKRRKAWAKEQEGAGGCRVQEGVRECRPKGRKERAEEQERAGPWTERSGPWATGGNDLGARRNGRGIGDSETKHGRQRPEAQGKSGQGTAVSNQNERIQTVHGPTHSGRLGRPKASQPTRSRQPVRTNPFGSTRPLQGIQTDTLTTTPPSQPIRVDSSNPRHPNRHARNNPSGPLPGPMREKSAADENIHPQCARRLDLFSYFCKN